MANRVLLDAAGLKVSMPGQNVLTASEGVLGFGATWLTATPYLKGTSTLPQTSGTVILYGKTFVRPPLVIYKVGLHQCIGGSAEITEAGSNTYPIWWLRVQTNGLHVMVSSAAAPFTIHYVVWEIV